MKRFMKIVMAMLVVAIGVGCCFAACGDSDGDKEIRLSGSFVDFSADAKVGRGV